MYRNYLKIAWRNIIRHKGFSFINIFGLAIGMAAALMLFLYIHVETGNDRFHQHGDKIYRVISAFGTDEKTISSRTFPQAGEHIKDNSPLIENVLRIKPELYNIRIEDREFGHERFYMTDPSFAGFFDFKVHSGNLEHALSDPLSVVLTWELAEKLFDEQDPINKVIEVEQLFIDIEMQRLSREYVPLRVGAVLEPLPKNTHMRFGALQSFEAYDPLFSETFALDAFVFLKTHNVLNEDNQTTINSLVKSYAVGIFGEEYEQILDFSVQPLHDIYFGDPGGSAMGISGNLNLIYIFSIVAFFIIAIAIINFVNLVTARSEKRAVEASIRKVSGANRSNISLQFLGESVLITLIAFLISVMLVELFITPFSNLLGRNLSLTAILNLPDILTFTGVVLGIGLIAGAYPAIMFSKYCPAEILRGKSRGGHKNPLLRIVLVVLQFAISVFLIISITVFDQQIKYMKKADLGFSPENVLVFSGLTNRLVSGYEPIKAELLQHPDVVHVTASQAYPGGGGGSGMTLRRAEDTAEKDLPVTELRILRDYKETFGLNIVKGRWFDFDRQTDLENFVVNETAIRAMGLTDPIGQDVIMWRRRGQIIGVVEDFHITSLRNEIEPLILTAYSNVMYHISIKIADQNNDVLDHIKTTFTAFDSNYKPYELYLENSFINYYKQEENNNKILRYASALAIIIAMLGIWGLSSYVIAARLKEISLRKVMGASAMQINKVLFSDITRWILLANFIAWPIAWYSMSRWLESYPYRIEMSVGYLLLAGFISLLIVTVTISGLTMKVSRANPADALRTE